MIIGDLLAKQVQHPQVAPYMPDRQCQRLFGHSNAYRPESVSQIGRRIGCSQIIQMAELPMLEGRHLTRVEQLEISKRYSASDDKREPAPCLPLKIVETSDAAQERRERR